MFSSAAVVALTVASAVLAAPTPTGPGPNTVVNAQSACDISWTADTATVKPWNNMTIELMTGENAQMTHMRTIASGIDTTKTTTFSWTCPDVDLNAPVVFYQFSDPSDPTNLQWVTRFTIATESGATVAAPNTDSNGIPWGIAHFTDTSLYNAIPGYLAGNGQLQGAPGNGTSTTGSTTTGSSTATSTGSTASKTGSSTMSTVTSHSSSSAPTSSTTTTSSSGAAQAFVASSSTSIMALVGAIMAGAVAVTSF